jgi:hypothetical protein
MKSERLIHIIPPYYRKSKIAHGILGATERESDRLVAFALDVIRQGNPITATWGLSQWEEELHLPAVPEGTPFHVRTARVLARLRLPPVITPKEMEKIAGEFTLSKKAEVIEYGRKKLFSVRVEIDDIISLIHMSEAIHEAKPTHLGFWVSLAIDDDKNIQIAHDVAQRLNFYPTTSIWGGMYSDVGAFIDGSWSINGRFCLHANQSEDLVNYVNLKEKMIVAHPFHAFEENMALSLNGEWDINGSFSLDHSPRMVERFSIEHQVKITPRSIYAKYIDGTWRLDGTQIISDARIMDGTWKMDGTYRMDSGRTLVL